MMRWCLVGDEPAHTSSRPPTTAAATTSSNSIWRLASSGSRRAVGVSVPAPSPSVSADIWVLSSHRERCTREERRRSTCGSGRTAELRTCGPGSAEPRCSHYYMSTCGTLCGSGRVRRTAWLKSHSEATFGSKAAFSERGPSRKRPLENGDKMEFRPTLKL